MMMGLLVACAEAIDVEPIQADWQGNWQGNCSGTLLFLDIRMSLDEKGDGELLAVDSDGEPFVDEEVPSAVTDGIELYAYFEPRKVGSMEGEHRQMSLYKDLELSGDLSAGRNNGTCVGWRTNSDYEEDSSHLTGGVLELALIEPE